MVLATMKAIVMCLLLVTATCFQLPNNCNYDNGTRALLCTQGYVMDLERIVSDIPHDVGNISITNAVVRTIPSTVGLLQRLTSLRLSHCRIEDLDSGALSYLYDLEHLDLDHNHIHDLDPIVFSRLERLKTFNLAHNHIESLPEDLFDGLSNLEVLSLKHNKLRSLDVNVFQNLNRLKSLDLSSNEIQHLNPDIFKPLLAVESITIHSNLLRTLSEDTFANMTALRSVSVEENPWVCNCGLQWLQKALNNKETSYEFKRHSMVKCLSPKSLHSLPLKRVPLDELVCSLPEIASKSHPVNILRHTDTTLRCVASGNPKPTIVWSTPFGTYMTTKANPWWITTEFANYTYSDPRYVLPTYTLTNISVLDNGDLHVQNMRNIWSGEYKCLAMNPGGLDEISFNVTMVTAIRGVLEFNLIVAAISVAITIVCGIFVCAIHQITRPKCLVSNTKSVSIKAPSPHLSITSDLSPKRSPYSAFYRYNTSLSEEDLYDLVDGSDITDTDDPTRAEWSNLKIKETLEDVKARLRQGKAQMDERFRVRRIKMRCQLQSIRESGSQYLQTIKDSSSKTAERVRSGVAIGVEQVKYHVRSLKEFCGTGDIGQTMSTVTISTNVDTAEQVEIVKNHTWV